MVSGWIPNRRSSVKLRLPDKGEFEVGPDGIGRNAGEVGSAFPRLPIRAASGRGERKEQSSFEARGRSTARKPSLQQLDLPSSFHSQLKA